MGLATLLIAGNILQAGIDRSMPQALRDAAFQIVSTSTTRRAFAVELEHIVDGQHGNATGSAIAIQKFDFEAIRRQQFHDGAHIAYLDVSVGWTFRVSP